MKEFANKCNTKVTAAALSAKTALANNEGMELIQVLVVSILAIVVGSLLLTTMKTEFTTQLATLSAKMTALFS
ncbi:MAG: hypothetical protein RR415_07700 [Ruthenibacterium sp.]